MDDKRDGYVKAHVTFANYGERDGPPVAGEYIWAKVTDVPGHYVLDNVPFFADFGLGDTVAATTVTLPDGSTQEHEITGVVTPSGNLTTRLFFDSPLTMEQRRQIAWAIRQYDGCVCEWANTQLLAVSIGPRHTAPEVLWSYVISGVAISDLFAYDENGALVQ